MTTTRYLTGAAVLAAAALVAAPAQAQELKIGIMAVLSGPQAVLGGQLRDGFNLNPIGVAWGLAHHPQGFWIMLAGGGGGGWLYFFKGDAANQYHQLKLPNNGRDMSLSADGTRVAVAHADNQLRIYALHAKAA